MGDVPIPKVKTGETTEATTDVPLPYLFNKSFEVAE